MGEERRIEMRMLPVDRWMLQRLHGDSHRPRVRTLAKVSWHGRFAPSPASAEPDLVMPPVVEPPAPHTIELPATIDSVDFFGAPAISQFDDVTDLADLAELAPPAAVSALDLDLFVAPQPAPVPPTEPVAAPDSIGSTIPTVTPRPIVAHEELDPDVRALVDELYEQARAELAGFDSGFASSFPIADPQPEPEPQPEPPAAIVVDEPAPRAMPEASPPEPRTARAPEPRASRPSAPLPMPPAPQASLGPSAGNGDTPPASRGGWVAAFVTENEQRARFRD